MKAKKLLALLLVLTLVVPVNAFASAGDTNRPASVEQLEKQIILSNSQGNDNVDLKNDESSATQADSSLLEKEVKRLTQIGKLIGEKSETVVNENATNPDLFFKPDDKVRIIVEVSGNPVNDIKSTNAVNKLKQTQTSVMTLMKNNGIKADIRHRYVQSINGFSTEVKYSDIAKIKSLPGVVKVYIARKHKLDMNTSRGMVNAEIVNQAIGEGGLGLKGEGMLVAIIDTGIDWRHKDFTLTDPSTAKYPNAASIQAKLDDTDCDNNGVDTDDDKWFSSKVPAGYDFADLDNDVIPDVGNMPLASPHGVHVAGIVAANGEIMGIAPEAQLLAEKVFSDSDESAYDDDINSAIEHAIAMDADVINMSLGSVAGFVGPDDPIQPFIDKATDKGIIVCVSAGNSGHNTKGVIDSTWPYPLAQDPDIGLVGSPGVGTNTLQVAAIENTTVMASALSYYVDGHKEGSGIYQAAGNINPVKLNGKELVYCGIGTPDKIPSDVAGKIALIMRGTLTFAEKQKNAQNAGAKGVVVFNNSGDGLISMATDPDLAIPAIFVGNTLGSELKNAIDNGSAVTLDISGDVMAVENPAIGQMMDGSAWGLTPNLDFKPEITAPGGNIYSTVNNDKYASMSGTSMSSPHAAGAAALVAQYLKSKHVAKNADFVKLAKTMLVNTAKVIINQTSSDNTPYSPRLQGSGLMKIDKAIKTPVTVVDSVYARAAVSLKEIDTDSKIKTFTLQLRAFDDATVPDTVYYNVYADVLTDLIFSKYDLQWNALETTPVEGASIKVNSKTVTEAVYEEVYVDRTGISNINFTLDLNNADSLPTESFVEGFISFVPTSHNPDIPPLTVPYVGFYGDWDVPRNVDPGIWEQDSYGGYTGLYDQITDPYATEDDLYPLGMDISGDIYPNNVAISPNGDNIQDVTSTVFTLLRNAKKFKLYVKDDKGNTVRKIFDNADWNEYKEGMRKNSTYGGENWYTFRPSVFDWDGKLANGSIASDGQYKMVIETTIDYPGAESQKYELPIKIDKVEPTLSSLNVVHQSGNDYLVSWNASDDYSGIQFVSIYADGNRVGITDENSFTIHSQPQKVEIFVWDYAGNYNYGKYINTTPVSSTINPTAATFERYAPANLVITMTPNGNTLSAIKNGTAILATPADYTVAGNVVTLKSSYLNTLPTGVYTIIFDFNNGVDPTLALTVINTSSSSNNGGGGSGSGGGGGSSSGSTAPTTPTVPTTGGNIQALTPTLNTTTKQAAAKVSESILASALANATTNSNGVKAVTITVPKVAGANSYGVELPTAAFSGATGAATQVVNIQTELGNLAIPNNMVSSELAAQGKPIAVSIGKADISKLPQDIQAQIGNRPVIELSLEVGGVVTAWSNPNAPVTVSVSYTPTAEELKNPDNIVVWYIDEAGNAIAVPNCKYDPATGMVTFQTTHFSKYAVVYAKNTFSDVTSYEKEITAIVARDILKPVSKTTFNPNTSITRADFIYGLVRALGLSAKADSNFTDVKASAYYYNEVAIAKKLGITNGSGNNMFKPETTITRQDMMTLIYRAMTIAKKLNASADINELSKFADNAKIASYAKASVASVVKEGIIKGDGTNINPQSNTSRAEAALILYRIFNK